MEPISPEQNLLGDEAPFDYKVPDYEDAIPISKSLTILGGIALFVAIIFFLMNHKGPSVPEVKDEKVDFSKMKSSPQSHQGQVAGTQDFTLPSPPPKSSPTPKTTETPTPTPTPSQDTPTNTPTPSPTNIPDPTATPTVAPTAEPTLSPTDTLPQETP